MKIALVVIGMLAMLAIGIVCGWGISAATWAASPTVIEIATPTPMTQVCTLYKQYGAYTRQCVPITQIP